MTDHRRKWFAMLAKLVHPADPKAAGVAMLPFVSLLGDFPDAAFSIRSLEFVAREIRRIPSYAELRAVLAQHWAMQPKPLLLEGPDSDGMTDMDREHLSSIERTRTDPGFRMEIRLGWLRSQAPAAFRHICRTDNEAAAVAVRRGWKVDDDPDPQRGWGDRQAVAATLAKAQARLPDGRPNAFSAAHTAAIRAALERYAPENLDLLEPAP